MNSTITASSGDIFLGEYRNKIINGNFDFWQRRTSAAGPSTTAAGFLADRWAAYVSGLGGGAWTFNTSRQAFTVGQTDVPGEPIYYHYMQNYISGASSAAWSGMIQSIEDVRLLQNKTVCVSFWAKGSVAGTLNVSLDQYFGSGGSSAVYISGKAINLTTSWQKFSFVFGVSSISGKTLGTGHYTYLRFWTYANASAASSFKLTEAINYTGYLALARVQLEIGNSPTEFEVRSIDAELALCQRYYEKSDSLATLPGTLEPYANRQNWWHVVNTQSISGYCTNYIKFNTIKRAEPVITTYIGSNPTYLNYVGITRATDGLEFSQSLPVLKKSNESGFLIRTNYSTQVYSGTDFEWTADAEFG